jgi:hypothetical protein
VNPATEISTHGSRTCIPLTKTLIYGTSVFYTWWHSWGYDCTGDTHKLVAVLTLVAHICGLVKMGTFGYLEMVMWSLSRQFPWHILCGASHHCVHGMWESTEFITTLVQKPCKYKTCIQHAAATISSFVTKKLNDGFENEIVTW